MLSQVLAEINDRGWFDTSIAYEKNIYLSQGASLWMVLTRGGCPDTFVKFSDLVNLQEESARCREASRCFERHAPQFVGFTCRESLSILVTRAVDFDAVTVNSFANTREADAVRNGLVEYFAQARTLVPETKHRQPPIWLGQVRQFFVDHRLRDVARPALDRLALLILNLRCIPQHGDLVMNNLGIKKSGSLAIFDWEDFGALSLPGLDLFTLEYSFAQGARWLRDHGRDSDTSRALGLPSLQAASGLDPEVFEQLRLPCALAFRYLKRNYGPEIQNQLDSVILALAKDGPA